MVAKQFSKEIGAEKVLVQKEWIFCSFNCANQMDMELIKIPEISINVPNKTVV